MNQPGSRSDRKNCIVTRMCHSKDSCILWSAQRRSFAFRDFRCRGLSALFARILSNLAL